MQYHSYRRRDFLFFLQRYFQHGQPQPQLSTLAIEDIVEHDLDSGHVFETKNPQHNILYFILPVAYGSYPWAVYMNVRSVPGHLQVNVAVIIDGSTSVGSTDFLLEKDFAKNAVASFASRNLFDNGGAAAFAQFSSSASEGGIFTSSEEFDAFVDDELQLFGGTDIIDGLAKGRELLDTNEATASFMILITDGQASDPSASINVLRMASLPTVNRWRLRPSL